MKFFTKHWRSMTRTPEALKSFPKPPMVAYRQPANLRKTLCHTKLPFSCLAITMYIPPTKLVFFSFKSPTKPVYFLKKHLPLSLQIPPEK